MALDPIGSNAQEAPPLTLALKSICQDYPAGGIVLRELLQNADDAGATCVVRSSDSNPFNDSLNGTDQHGSASFSTKRHTQWTVSFTSNSNSTKDRHC